jgi:hypothetical protein
MAKVTDVFLNGTHGANIMNEAIKEFIFTILFY